MNRYFLTLLLVGVSLPAWASHRYERFEVFVSASTGSWDAATGDKVGFDISVSEYNLPAEGTISYEISEDMMPPRKKGEVRLKKGKATVDAGTMSVPGFLRCKAIFTADDGRQYTSAGTYAFSKDALKPTVEMPSDFAGFWSNSIASSRSTPLAPKMERIPEECSDRVEVYRISYSVSNPDTRFYGVLAMPKEEGRYPAVVQYPGAGVHPIRPEIQYAERGIIALAIGIHGLPDNVGDEVRKSLDWGALQNYQTFNMDDRERYYYNRVVKGAVRAVDFVLSLPECDGVVGVCGGSQGGFLAIATAALHPGVRCLMAHFPAMSDQTGYLSGRAGGWPHTLGYEVNRTPEIIRTLSYYDTVNFARLIKIPGFYTYGYNDTTCPPTSVCSVFNTIDAPKQIRIAPTTEHYTFTEQYWDSFDAFAGMLKSLSDEAAR